MCFGSLLIFTLIQHKDKKCFTCGFYEICHRSGIPVCELELRHSSGPLFVSLKMHAELMVVTFSQYACSSKGEKALIGICSYSCFTVAED
jgi:hypothetical protein